MNFIFDRIPRNMLNNVATSYLVPLICTHLLYHALGEDSTGANTMAPSYAQGTAKSCQIHGTVNVPFKRPVHARYAGAWTSPLALEFLPGMSRKREGPKSKEAITWNLLAQNASFAPATEFT